MKYQTERQAWMKLLAKSSVVDRERQVQTLGKLPEYSFLRSPLTIKDSLRLEDRAKINLSLCGS